MGAGDLEPLDLLYTDASDDDEPRLKVGDQASGAGVGQDCAYLATDGFVSLPNPPDANGGCATGVCWTPGNDRIVIAASDSRYNGKAGTLAAGDRAIVSNCDAFFRLSQAGNSITLGSAGMSVELDGVAGKITASTALGGFQVGPSGVGASWTPGGNIVASMNLTSAYASIAFGGPAGVCSIVLKADGSIAVLTVPGSGTPSSPSGVTINGVPLVVP